MLQSLIKSHPCLSLAFTHQVAFVNQLRCQHDSFNLCLKRWKKVISSVFKQFQLWKLDFLTQRVFLSVILIQPAYLSNDFQVIVWNFDKASLDNKCKNVILNLLNVVTNLIVGYITKPKVKNCNHNFVAIIKNKWILKKIETSLIWDFVQGYPCIPNYIIIDYCVFLLSVDYMTDSKS